MEYRYIFIEDTAFSVILGAATITAVVGCVLELCGDYPTKLVLFS